jgi:hypothetical protein
MLLNDFNGGRKQIFGVPYPIGTLNSGGAATDVCISVARNSIQTLRGTKDACGNHVRYRTGCAFATRAPPRV